MTPKPERHLTLDHLLGLAGVGRDDIELMLDTAAVFQEIARRPIKKVPTLRGKTVINYFHEASTRTRTSFEIAGKWLSADVVNFSASSSSTTKGETLLDTAKTLNSMAPDVIVIRHPAPGAPLMLTKATDAAIINAGDGACEHPTQALLDMLTIRDHRGSLEGLKIAIVGDIAHSRVARSNLWGLTTMGAEVVLCGPPTCIPPAIDRLGARVTHSIDEVVPWADCLMMLRIQRERGAMTRLPSLREYSRLFGLNPRRLENAREDLLVMHPGPINRGVEIDPQVADGPWSVILEQVQNGVAVRMALLYLMSGSASEGGD